MALLACAYLAVQYLLALGKAGFIVVLGIAAAAEPLLLLVIGAHLRDVALALFGLQLALAVAVVVISFRSAAHPALRRLVGGLAVEAALALIEGVEGWLSEAQARRLYEPPPGRCRRPGA